MEALPKSQLLRFVEQAMHLARRAVARYSSKFSKRRYTLHQHIVLLCPKVRKNTTYRTLLDELIEMPRIQSALDLEEIPSPSPLCKTFSRFDMAVWRVLLNISVTLLPTNGVVGIDATGFDRSHASKHYIARERCVVSGFDHDVGFAPEPLSTEKREFVRDCEPAVEEHTPSLREELRGLADAGDWDLERIEAMPLALGYEAGCSVVAVSGEHTVDGKPRFGRNYDFYESFGDFSELYRTRPTDHLASVGCSDHWVGRHDGINEAGVAIGHTFVPNDGSEPGIMFGLAARAVLDTCRTVDDAVAFLERIPHARNTNFLVADAAGDIASIEASPEAVTTTRPTNGVGAVTNHYQSDSMLGCEHREERSESSETRLENLNDWFDTRRGGFDTADVQHVLTDPEGGVCSCANENEDDPILTLWSLAVTPGETPGTLAKGSPNDVEHEPVDL